MDALFEEDDDDEIILVSSTRQKWEKLHGIGSGNLPSTTKASDGNSENNEDDILVVAIKPVINEYRKPKDSINKRASIFETIQQRLFGIIVNEESEGNAIIGFWIPHQFQICMLVLALGYSVAIRKRLVRKRRFGAMKRAQNIEGDGKEKSDGTKSSSPTKETAKEATKAEGNETQFEKNVNKEKSAVNDEDALREASLDVDRSEKISLQSNLLDATALSLSSKTLQGDETSITMQTKTQDQKRKMAQQFAQDIRLVQDVLAEYSLDPAMAPQLAMSLQSSQQIIDSQRELCFQKAMIDAHQKHLDRQLSERQHQESLQGQKYDPNWREKFQSMRDQSYYWNASNGGSGRLWWEVLLIQQLARGIMPVWRYYYLTEMQRWDNGSFSGNEVYNSEMLGRLVTSILKDTLVSVLGQICDCRSTSYTSGTNPSTIATSWAMTRGPSAVISLSSGIIAGLIEHWSCYGYCVLLGSSLLVVTIVAHQGLRIMSVPAPVHHLVNLLSIMIFYGAQRTLSLFASIFLRILMVVPEGWSDGFDSDDHDGVQRGHSRRILGCSFLLLCLWIVFPLMSWLRTHTICRELEARIARADPVAFESVFLEAKHRLGQWQWHQMAVRYLFLSIYSAMVFWEYCEGTALSH